MDRGKIVEIGQHEDLMAKEGHYWRLYQAQTKQLDALPALGETLPEMEVAA
jgi:ATP-binding cassette subfamily B protein